MELRDSLRATAAMCLRLEAAHALAMKADLPLAFVIATASAKQEAGALLDDLLLRYLNSIAKRSVTPHRSATR